MIRKITSVLIILFSFSSISTQVGIGTTNPDASSVLDLVASDKGILVPRMAESDRTTILSPAKGLLVFQMDGTEGFYYYNGSVWVHINAEGYLEGPLLESDPKIGSSSSNKIPKWNGSGLIDGTISDVSNQIGIGLSSPGADLHIRKPTNTSLLVETNGGTSYSTVNTSSGAGTLSIVSNKIGGPILGVPNNSVGIAAAGQSIHIVPNGIVAMTLDNQGYVGIGVQDPLYPLQIVGKREGFFHNPAYYLDDGAGHGSNGTSWRYGVHSAEAFFSAEGFATGSDARIKQIIGKSNAENDLELLMDIEVTDYMFKDTIAEGTLVTKKVIAQQLKEILPNAVNYSIDFIPDIYAIANIEENKGGTITLSISSSPELKEGDILRLIPRNGTVLNGKVSVINDDSYILTGDFQGLNDEELFVYGRQVSDFQSVDYDAISMLNVSATQEQQRRIERLELENKQLKDKYEQLQDDLERILSQIDNHKRPSVEEGTKAKE